MSKGFHYEPTRKTSVEWFTPPRIFKALNLHFHMDVASPPAGETTWVPANRFLTQADDGLSTPWEGRVWCNPPYGPHIDQWIAKMQTHRNGLLLLPARTDTKWFQKYTPNADAICFVAGRIHFLPGDGQHVAGPGIAEILLAYGQTCTIALIMSKLGTTFLNHPNKGITPCHPLKP